MNRLEGKVALITGAARGMGESHARRFVAEGARVIMTDRSEGPGRALADELGANTLFLKHEVTDAGQWAEVVAKGEQVFGPITVLVNNAGILGPMVETADLAEADYHQVCAVNQHSVFLGMRAVLPSMLRAGRGSIVNISSIAGSTALGRGNFAYSVTKGGVDAMTRELAVEWGRHGVRVNAVAPCQVATAGFLANEKARTQAGDPTVSDYRRGIPMGRAAEPADIAAAVVYLASDAAAMVTGVTLPVDGGNLAFNAGGTLG